jgi:hypothetical protein
VDREAKLQWERRAGRPAAVAAFIAAGLQVLTYALQASAFADRPEGDRGVLLTLDDKSGQVIAGVSVQVLSTFLIVAVLLYLFRASGHRRQLPPGFVGVIALAPLLTAVGLFWTQIDLVDVADRFTSSGVTEGRAGEERAEDLLDDRRQAPLFFALAGNLALAFSYVFVSLNAMRTGLLSRFMGILGIIVGVLLVLPLLPGGPSVVQLFWLGAVGLLLLDRWPGGRGPAWESGAEEPWPSAAERRGVAAAEQPAADAEPAQPRPASRKRKRKRRR